MMYIKSVCLDSNYYNQLIQLADMNEVDSTVLLKILVEQAIDERMHNYCDDSLTDSYSTNI